MERFTFSPAMIEQLRTIQAEQMARYADPVLHEHDAVVATYGLGPAMYLCLDGRVLIQDNDQDEPAPVETENENDLRATRLILDKRYSLPELLAPELFPPKPLGASNCRICLGTRWIQGKIVCYPCRALGWIVADDQSK
jgi:hypothetical protein